MRSLDDYQWPILRLLSFIFFGSPKTTKANQQKDTSSGTEPLYDMSFFLISILCQFPQLWISFIQATCLASFAHCVRKHAQQVPQYLWKFLSSLGLGVRELPTSLERASYSVFSCNSDWTLQNVSSPSHLQRIVFKRKLLSICAYLSISDGFVHLFFWLGRLVATWHEKRLSQSRIKQKSDDSKFLPPSYQNHPKPSSNMYSQFKSKLEFDVFFGKPLLYLFEKDHWSHTINLQFIWKNSMETKLPFPKKTTWHG